MRILFFLLFVSCWVPTSYAQDFKLAIIGDSYSTGAWSRPNASLDPAQFDAMFMSGDKLTSVIQQRMPQDVEYQNAYFWVAKNVIVAMTQSYLDNPDQSWVAQKSKDEKIDPKEVLLLARDGAGISDAYSQTKSLLALTGGKAPLKTVYFFSLMDTCAPTPTMFTTPEVYEKYWEDTLRYFLRHAKLGPYSTVELWAPLNVTQAVTNPAILQADIPSKGSTPPKTCKELALQKFEGYSKSMFGSAMYLLHPALYCSSLMNAAGQKDPASDPGLLAIANHWRQYRQKLGGLAQKLNKELKREVFVYKDAVAEFAFKPEYMAPDCLHLNDAGQLALSQY